MPRNLGVLAIQGGYAKHREMLERLGHTVTDVRTAGDLDAVDGLVMPGGESTTIAKLLVNFGVAGPLSDRIQAGMPVFGTCAGMILLAASVTGKNEYHFGALDIDVQRNAYGRQVESFEEDVELTGEETPFRAVFIRAPKITRVGADVEVLATCEGDPVLVRQGAVLAASFHPELTDDSRVHRLFLDLLGK